MALLYIEGFDALATADGSDVAERGWIIGSLANTYTVAGGGRSGAGNCLRLDGTSASLVRSIPAVAGGTALYAGFGLKLLGIPSSSNYPIYYAGNGSAAQVTVNINTSGQLIAGAVSSGAMGTSILTYANLATSVNSLSTNTWYYIEVKFVISDTVGVVEVRVDGTSTNWLNVTSADTNRNSSALDTSLNTVCLIAPTGTGDGAYFDDLYLASGSGGAVTNFLSDVIVKTILPSTGNGSNTDFTLSTGTDHGAVVDDAAPNDDTDYSYSSTLNHIETLNYPALGVTGTVYGVQVVPHVKRSTGGVRGFAAVSRISSTNYVNATTLYPATSYQGVPTLMETSPATSSAWTVSEIDGAEFGVKVTA